MPLRETDWILRSVLVVNLAVLVLTCIPGFSGIGQVPGYADRLLGGFRLGGWRADVVWMCVSTCVIAAAAFPGPGIERPRRRTAILCRMWLPCFGAYLGYIVTHMFG